VDKIACKDSEGGETVWERQQNHGTLHEVSAAIIITMMREMLAG
jgi:hypothetical protein